MPLAGVVPGAAAAAAPVVEQKKDTRRNVLYNRASERDADRAGTTTHFPHTHWVLQDGKAACCY